MNLLLMNLIILGGMKIQKEKGGCIILQINLEVKLFKKNHKNIIIYIFLLHILHSY